MPKTRKMAPWAKLPPQQNYYQQTHLNGLGEHTQENEVMFKINFCPVLRYTDGLLEGEYLKKLLSCFSMKIPIIRAISVIISYLFWNHRMKLTTNQAQWILNIQKEKWDHLLKLVLPLILPETFALPQQELLVVYKDQVLSIQEERWTT